MITFITERHCDLCEKPIIPDTPAMQSTVKGDRRTYHHSCYLVNKIEYHKSEIKRLTAWLVLRKDRK